MQNQLAALVVMSACLTAAPPATADDWLQWRGPTGDNHAPAGATAPTKWSESENIAWRTPVPGRGHSSPILIGDRIYLTTADDRAETQSLLIFDRATGKLLKQTLCHEGGFEAGIHRNNTYASQTIASDGERVFAVFSNKAAVWLTALDLAGEQLWQTRVAPYTPRRYSFGYGTSPVYVDGKVIVTSEFDGRGSAIVAFDAKSGEEAWRTSRPEYLTYSPPARLPTDSGTQLLISGNFLMAAYSPVEGRELWSVTGPWQATCGVMVWDKASGLAFASGGGGANTRNATCAVTLAAPHEIVWEQPVKCYEPSMLVVDGYLYGVSANVGVAYCWRCSDGEEMWKKRLGAGGSFSSSPVLVDGKLYLTSEEGVTIVFDATHEGYNELSRNTLGDEAFATPTPADGRLYHRYATSEGGDRQEYLVAIGE